MSFDYINEAFKKLNMLDEDVFDTSVGGLNNLANFMDNDDEDIVKVIDPEAETNDELSGSYVGKVIIDCNVCHSKIFSAKEDIVLSEDGIVNPEEQCPYCGETSGFTVIGEIKEFEQEEAEQAPTEDTEASDKDADSSENLDEGIFGLGKKRSEKTIKVSQLKKGDTFISSKYTGNISDEENPEPAKVNRLETQPDGSVVIFYKQGKAQGSTHLDADDEVVALTEDLHMFETMSEAFEERPDGTIKSYNSNKPKFWDASVWDPKYDKDGKLIPMPEFTRLTDKEVDELQKKYGDKLITKPSKEQGEVNEDVEEPLTEEFDTFTAVSTFLTGKGYDVSSKEGKAYVWGVVDYLDLGDIAPTSENLESWLQDTLADDEYRSELEACCTQQEVQEELTDETDSLDEAYFRPVEGEAGVKRALIDSCNEYTVTLLEITDDDGVWYEVGINHPTQNFEQVEIGEYKTQQFAENVAQKVISQLDKYVELEELSSIYDFNTRNIYNKVASRMPETEPTTEELNEDIQNLSLTTDETQVKLTSDENGKVTLVTEPVIKEEAEPEVVEEEPVGESELEIAPVSDETVDAIVDNNEVETDEEPAAEDELPVEETAEGEEDVALDEVDEAGLDELGESYMRAVYENVESFKTTNVSANDTHIVVEGLIKFTSGTERKTGFIFEAHTAKDNKVNFKGCNEHFSKDRNSFTLDCSVVDRKLLPESLSYNYDVDGRKISGTVTRKGV